jgi:putative transcriptional regulator
VRTKRGKDGMTPRMWARLRAMTDDEVLAAARRDPDARPLEDRDPAKLNPPRHLSPVKRIRWQLGMSQSDFAKTFRIPLATLRDWELHRQEPDQLAVAYLQVIARDPNAVRRALLGRAAAEA